ncbi:hypothetical protein ICV35_27210, partial [Rhodococcus ruber]|uniref:hypothetical protein n=5 Tax=Nocardiaceae TaxID=85025 RepID=UPI0017828421
MLALLQAQAATVEQSMRILRRWGHDEILTRDAVAELRSATAAEHAARRDLHNAVRDSFSTPLEAEDLFELGERLGEIPEAGYALVRESELSCAGLTCTEPDPYLVGLLDALADAAVPLLDGLRALPRGTAATYADRTIEKLSAAEHAYRVAIESSLVSLRVSQISRKDHPQTHHGEL